MTEIKLPLPSRNTRLPNNPLSRRGGHGDGGRTKTRTAPAVGCSGGLGAVVLLQQGPRRLVLAGLAGGLDGLALRADHVGEAAPELVEGLGQLVEPPHGLLHAGGDDDQTDRGDNCRNHEDELSHASTSASGRPPNNRVQQRGRPRGTCGSRLREPPTPSAATTG
jgi:hypothetical protein